MTKKILSIALVLCTLLSFATVMSSATWGITINGDSSISLYKDEEKSLKITIDSVDVTWDVPSTSDFTFSYVSDSEYKVKANGCSGTATVTVTNNDLNSNKVTFTITANHNYAEANGSKKVADANCAHPELYAYKCSCGEADLGNTFPVGSKTNNHTFVDYDTEGTLKSYMKQKNTATCTVKETWYKYCSVCKTSAQDIAGSENQTFTVGNTLNHDWKKIADEIAPTCKDYGYKAKYECTVCKATKGGEQIAKLTTHTDADNDDYCDCCNKYLGEVVIDSTFKCSMCPTYEAKKDIPFIGVIYEIVHFFVHLIESINDLT